MNRDLNDIKSHIPTDILEANPELVKLANILNGMHELRSAELDKYARSFLFPLIEDTNLIKRYIESYGGEYSIENRLKSLQYLYMNRHYILSRRGTRLGLVRLLEALFWVGDKPTVEVTDFDFGQPFLLLDEDLSYDQLIDGEGLAENFDLQTESPSVADGDKPALKDSSGNAVNVAYNDILTAKTLLDKTWAEHKNKVVIDITVDYTPKTEFLTFVRSIVINYVPMVSKNFFIAVFNINSGTIIIEEPNVFAEITF